MTDVYTLSIDMKKLAKLGKKEEKAYKEEQEDDKALGYTIKGEPEVVGAELADDGEVLNVWADTQLGRVDISITLDDYPYFLMEACKAALKKLNKLKTVMEGLS